MKVDGVNLEEDLPVNESVALFLSISTFEMYFTWISCFCLGYMENYGSFSIT